MRTNIDGEASEKQPPEDEVRFVVIRKKGEYPVHQVRRFLVPGEKKGYQSLESLIVVQRVESDEAFLEDTLMGLRLEDCGSDPGSAMLPLEAGQLLRGRTSSCLWLHSGSQTERPLCKPNFRPVRPEGG